MGRASMPSGLLERCERWMRAAPRAERHEPRYATLLPGLRLVAHEEGTEFEANLYDPIVCVPLTGRKETSFGEHTHVVGALDCLLVSHDLPVVSRVVRAPYLALLVDVDLGVLRSLYDELGAPMAEGGEARALEVQPAGAPLLDVLARYVALADAKLDAKVLAPLVRKELHYRLLTAPFGGMLRSLLRYDSAASAVASAIALIRQRYREPLTVASLAREVGMSVSVFHRHFRAVTASTPLQYQKELRLMEARRLLRSGAGSVSAVAYQVGYESPNQFSREYARKFAIAPKTDRVPREVHR